MNIGARDPPAAAAAALVFLLLRRVVAAAHCHATAVALGANIEPSVFPRDNEFVDGSPMTLAMR